MLSKSISSTRVAPAEWNAKLIPSGETVGPSGSGWPGNRFVIVGIGPLSAKGPRESIGGRHAARAANRGPGCQGPAHLRVASSPSGTTKPKDNIHDETRYRSLPANRSVSRRAIAL